MSFTQGMTNTVLYTRNDQHTVDIFHYHRYDATMASIIHIHVQSTLALTFLPYRRNSLHGYMAVSSSFCLPPNQFSLLKQKQTNKQKGGGEEEEKIQQLRYLLIHNFHAK